jgi:hypothetical protein
VTKRKRIISLCVASVLVAGAVVLVWPRGPKEPEYGGKKLSEWMEESGFSYWISGNRYYVMSREAQNALHHIGTNAIPYLVQWVGYEPPSWKTKLYAIIQKTFHYTFIDHRSLARASRAEGATAALQTLGPKAEGAIPELATLANNPKATNSARRATAVLSRLQGKLLSADIALMTNSSANVRLRSINLVVEQYLNGEWPGTSLSPALLVVVQRLTDEDRNVRNAAAHGLGQLHVKSRIAIPELMKLLKHPDPQIRILAADAIEQIDPSALEKVGPSVEKIERKGEAEHITP